MQQQDIFALAYELQSEIVNSDLYKEVKEKENKMLGDQATFMLLNKYQTAQEEYNEALRFKDYGGNVKEKQLEMYKIKLEVDANPLVRSYNEAYKRLSDLLDKIEKTIFKGLIDPSKGKKKCA